VKSVGRYPFPLVWRELELGRRVVFCGFSQTLQDVLLGLVLVAQVAVAHSVAGVVVSPWSSPVSPGTTEAVGGRPIDDIHLEDGVVVEVLVRVEWLVHDVLNDVLYDGCGVELGHGGGGQVDGEAVRGAVGHRLHL